jgi:predicted CoA-substrate-specific enzyme activase
MYYIGIDIGFTSSKTVVFNDSRELVTKLIQPTGWSSIDTANDVKEQLLSQGIDVSKSFCTATGYGRMSVPYAKKAVTEITCHARGAVWLFHSTNITVIDIGSHDTKIVRVENGKIKDFMMNDKCAAGTGRFLEIMAGIMGIRPDEICQLARNGGGTSISSTCAVFAETEVLRMIRSGELKENVAYAIVDSISNKITSQCSRIIVPNDKVCLTGGLCECDYLTELLSERLECEIQSGPDCRYAGAIGAALSAPALK